MTKFQEFFKKTIDLSEIGRPGYKISLGKGIGRELIEQILTPAINDLPNIPEIYFEIYEIISGTPRGIQDQKNIDFIPGYRLIEIYELPDLIDKFQFNPGHLPLLTNYSSDFICFSINESGMESGIYLALHDEPDLEMLHKNKIDFIKTIFEFYNSGVYFIDDDGYLESDDKKEDEIGKQMNPEIEC